MRTWATTATIVGLACAGLSVADPIQNFELLDPADWPDTPADRVVIDIGVTIDPNEAWLQSGVVGSARSGARSVYATDPNAGSLLLTAPDRGSGGRFVSFVSAPRPQNADSRSRWPVLVGTSNGAIPTAEPTWIDSSGLWQPGTVNGSGYVERIVLDLSLAGALLEDAYISTEGQVHPDDIWLASFNSRVRGGAALLVATHTPKYVLTQICLAKLNLRW